MTKIKRIVFFLLVLTLFVGTESVADVQTHSRGNETLQLAYEQQQSNIQVEGIGFVKKILSDDKSGSRHQRFILKLSTGQTLLIAHNIDLAKRVGDLQVGDEVRFFGEYEWNKAGGVVHWTHRDPRGKHVSGWIKHKGVTYH